MLEQGPRHTTAEFQHDEFANRIDRKLSNNLGAIRRPSAAASEVANRVKDPGRVLCAQGRRQQLAFHRKLLAPARGRFRRTQRRPIPGTRFADWPISYEELEPYYTKVEWEVGVSGLAGASPFDPPRSRPYPMPPLPVKSSGVLFERGARKLGLHPFPAPMAIASVPYKGRAACAHCGLCNGFGCEMQAKSGTVWTMIPEAEATGNCEVRPLSYVTRIETNAAGRTTGVPYFDPDRREHFQKARGVVVCANGAETPRLLLNSANAMFPQGLANSSGMLGKNLMFNTYVQSHALFEHELNEFKSVQVTRIVHDWYDNDPKRGFYGGGGLDGRIGPMPLAWSMFAPPPDRQWGAGLKSMLAALPRAMVVSSHGTSLPLESNAVDLDPELKDAWGMPALRVTYRDHPDDLSFARFLQDRSVEIMQAAGALRPGKTR